MVSTNTTKQGKFLRFTYLRSGTRQGYLLLMPPFIIVLRVLDNTIILGEEIDINIWKEELTLFIVSRSTININKEVQQVC